MDVFYTFPEEKLWANVCCGIVAGVVSSAIANPTDVLKVSHGLCVYTCNDRLLTSPVLSVFRKHHGVHEYALIVRSLAL